LRQQGEGSRGTAGGKDRTMKLAAGKLIHYGYFGRESNRSWQGLQPNTQQSQFVANIFLWKIDRHCSGCGAFPGIPVKAFNFDQFWHHR